MLIVEDGSGLANAESYVSVSDCAAYATARGLTFPATPEDKAEAALRRATTWLDGTYRGSFPGRRKKGRSQALEWPRIEAEDVSGNPIADSEIPEEIIAATCEAAVRELAAPGALNPDVTPGKIKKRAKVGDIEVEYAIGAGTVGEQLPVMSVIDGILGTLFRIFRGIAVFGRAGRV